MTPQEPDLVQALRSIAALPVTDDDVERARRRFRDGLAHHQQTRRRATVAAVLVALLTVATALVALSGRDDTKSLPALTPSTTVGVIPTVLPTVSPYAYGGEPTNVPTVGLTGFPPQGTTPSSTQQASELGGFQVFDGGRPYRGSARLYADGRFVWYLFYGPGNTKSTGYIEQRLTPYGVQILVNQPAGTSQDPWNLEKWLPASAWADGTMRPYVPTHYGACAKAGDPNAPIDERVWGTPGVPMPRLDLLALFPPTVADLLQGREVLPPLEDAEDCLRLTTAEARVLDRALVDAGFDKNDTYVLEYWTPIPGRAEVLSVRLEPVMPDGTVGCSSCG